ncbi:hypothetical protein C2E20_0785 [Micractinium conductrix]|uniref:Uncharacterized protein n=1 Tax=Micractinium conductrix TaxID=554055 RepID=A0A2P6VQ43_9CHLO|nr:hypothetical protein C2E20_0785 [Micractinium conductrix]|eukprot:PSC76218.1 hypothetical protein C2E20_0785 [Micractinium conductrix]
MEAASPVFHGALQKLELLAEGLALDWSLSQASEGCAATLARLLPGLAWASIAVSNPAHHGGLVASGNLAAAGPTTLHLHDPLYSAAGRALAHGKPLQLSLADSSAAAVVAAWTDVQVMAAHAPAVSHLLCVPFGCSNASAAGSTGHSHPHGSGSGALLLGFPSPPALEPPRKAMLAALAACLPAPMARLSADTLCFVNFACGSQQQCGCCCGADEDDDEEVEEEQEEQEEQERGKGSLETRAAAAASTAAGAAGAPPLPHGERSSPPSPAGLSPRISKSLLTEVAGGGEAALAQHPLTLAFRSEQAEAEYGRWMAARHITGDALASVLLLTSLCVVAFVEPYRLVLRAPGALATMLCLLLPLLYARFLGRRQSLLWREALVAGFRLYSIVFVTMVCRHTYEARLHADRLSHWVMLWGVTGADSLTLMLLRFRTHLALHLLLHLVSFAVAVTSMPGMRGCFPCLAVRSCLEGSAVAAGARDGGGGLVLRPAACGVSLCLWRRRTTLAPQAWRHLTAASYCVQRGHISVQTPGDQAMMAPPAGSQKLQLLADALALQFAQSEASVACASALSRLLPGLQYLGIAVSNPAQSGGIVESANCAVEGPTTLHLHDPLFSAAGRALAHGKPLQLSLADGSAAAVVAAWTDVQVMAVHAPAVSHLLCVPFGCSNASAAGSTGHSHPHGSGSGALLLGFPSPPALEPPRKAMLAALAACMPAPMARLSADTLSFVNFACGSQQQCSCCCGVDEEEEEDDGVPSSPCREDDHSAGGRNNGAGPSQALRVPGALAAGGGGAPGSSTRWWEEESEEGGKLSLKARAAAAGSAAAAASLPRASPAAPALRFSKALLAAAAGGGEEFTAQSSLTLAFRSSLMEGEFARWVSQYHVKVDLLFSLLLVVALATMSFIHPYRLVDAGPASLLLGAGMAAPLLGLWLARSRYVAWRERLAIALRLYTVAFINLVSMASYQHHLPRHCLQHWITFWMLTGSESLAVTALGFPIRLQLHLPLQFLSMALSSWNIPRMCHECYPGANAGTCFKSSAAMAALCGYILPTVALRFLEQRSRALFSSRLRANAVHLN